MTVTDNPMDKLAKLRNALDVLAKKHHLERLQVTFSPSEGGAPDAMFLVFKLGRELLVSSDVLEQEEFDSSFEDIIRMEQIAEKEQRQQEQAKSMAEELAQEFLDGDDS